jgi:hypothetical protein
MNRIYISKENHKKLKQIGVGSSNDKLSTLLDQHEQVLIDQSKPSATTKNVPPTDYFLGLIIMYYLMVDKNISSNPINKIYEKESRSRQSLRYEIEEVTRQNGWHHEYPTFFEGIRKKDSRFLKKLDKCLKLLVRYKILERVDGGYKLIPALELPTQKHLHALQFQTVTSIPPKIYYKKNQKRKTFKDGTPVPSIDILGDCI